MRRFWLFKVMLLFCFYSYSQCPYHSVNCIRGCPRYIDENKDSFCDNAIIIHDTSYYRKIQYIKSLQEKDKKTLPKQHDAAKTEKTADAKTVANDTIPKSSDTLSTGKGQEKYDYISRSKKRVYDLIPIFAAVLALYLLTYFLYGKRKNSHIKMWNYALLLAFMGSALLGVFMVIQINYKFCIDYFSDIIYWHVESGIAFSMIGILHIIWHWRYFVSFLSRSKES